MSEGVTIGRAALGAPYLLSCRAGMATGRAWHPPVVLHVPRAISTVTIVV